MSAVEYVFVVQQLVLLMPKELAAHEPGLVHVEAVEAGDQVLGEAPGLAAVQERVEHEPGVDGVLGVTADLVGKGAASSKMCESSLG